MSKYSRYWPVFWPDMLLWNKMNIKSIDSKAPCSYRNPKADKTIADFISILVTQFLVVFHWFHSFWDTRKWQGGWRNAGGWIIMVDTLAVGRGRVRSGRDRKLLRSHETCGKYRFYCRSISRKLPTNGYLDILDGEFVCPLVWSRDRLALAFTTVTWPRRSPDASMHIKTCCLVFDSWAILKIWWYFFFD